MKNMISICHGKPSREIALIGDDNLVIGKA